MGGVDDGPRICWTAHISCSRRFPFFYPVLVLLLVLNTGKDNFGSPVGSHERDRGLGHPDLPAFAGGHRCLPLPIIQDPRPAASGSISFFGPAAVDLFASS